MKKQKWRFNYARYNSHVIVRLMFMPDIFLCVTAVEDLDPIRSSNVKGRPASQS